MKKRISSLSIIRMISIKDMKSYSRDKVWMVLTPFLLVAIIILFWVLPRSVDETIVVGIHQENMGRYIEAFEKGSAAEQGLKIVEFDSAEDMADAIEEGKDVKGPDGKKVGVGIGIDFGGDFLENIQSGRDTEVDIYLAPSVAEEEKTGVSSFVREFAYSVAGDELPVKMPAEDEIILGEDRIGRQVPLRDVMLPILVFIVLLTESMALSSLVAAEVHSKTIQALEVSPATTGEIIISKTGTGTLLAFSQGALLLLLTGVFTSSNWLLLLIVVLLASFMMAGVGILSGSVGKDFMGTLFVSMIFFLPMIVPTFAAIFPGTQSFWIKLIPTYASVQSLVNICAYGKGWSENLVYMGLAAAWSVVFVSIGVVALQRKVAKL